MAAKEVPAKIETGVKARVDATRDSVKKEVEIAKTFVKDITTLKPVKAVIDLGLDTLDNVGDLIKKQAELTRDWIK
ncbi:MAG: hypothetical protein D4S01_10600 [Dehalococcoidia bacterium]|nr:MAG: hypothetical protein D4S01_10600 [Dehalococcoidia bacterium]